MIHYQNYLKERQNVDLFYDDKGFATYKKHGDLGIYIIDVYVEPAFRQKRVASSYLDEIAKLTKCEILITSCDESANNWKESEKAILGYGFKYKTKENDLRWYIKELK